jgi:hypothetical protein
VYVYVYVHVCVCVYVLVFAHLSENLDCCIVGAGGLVKEEIIRTDIPADPYSSALAPLYSRSIPKLPLTVLAAERMKLPDRVSEVGVKV